MGTEAARQIGVTQQTFYRWRTEFGGVGIDLARRLKHLESENSRFSVLEPWLEGNVLPLPTIR